MFLKKLHESLNSSIEQSGLEKANPLQKKVIGQLKSGADVVCIGNEKSGKTTAIAISVIQILEKAIDDVPRAVIVVANKAKAEAMTELFDTLGRQTDLRVFQVDSRGNIDDLRDKVYAGSDVIIGTAKKIAKLYSIHGLNLNGLKMFIIDDAEITISGELNSQIDRLSEIIPKAQRVLFASVRSERMERFVENSMIFPKIIISH